MVLELSGSRRDQPTNRNDARRLRIETMGVKIYNFELREALWDDDWVRLRHQRLSSRRDSALR